MSDATIHRLSLREEDYHADALPEALTGGRPSLSNSLAKVLLDRSPAHAYARHPRLGGAPQQDTMVFSRGKLAHKLLLGKGAEVVVIDAADWRSEEAREARDAAWAEGKIPTLKDAYVTAVEAAEVVRGKLAKRGVVLGGESELQLAWTEVRHGEPVWCRGMLDHLVIDGDRATIYDLKTTRDASPRACANAIIKYGYDTQRAAYTRAVERLYPQVSRVDFKFIFAETEPPFAMTHGTLDEVMRVRGEERWLQAVDTWAECLRFGQWPEYAWSEVEFQAPAWLGGDIEIGFEEEGESDGSH